MKIVKIGGANFNKSDDFIRLIDYLKNANVPILCVVSAFGKISTQLVDYMNNHNNSAFDNNPLNLFNEYLQLLQGDELENFEQNLLNAKILVQNRIDGINITKELHSSIVDEVLSFGELVSSFFIHCLLNSYNIKNIFEDSRQLIKTNSEFGNAKPNIEKSIKNISSKFRDTGIYITQGFIASNDEDRTTTMGFESSNLSAMIYAKALSTKTIEIITNVEQIKTYDPKISQNIKGVKYLPYHSAKVLANNGFKLLFPGMIDLAEKSGIEIIYRGLYGDKCTTVSKNNEFTCPVVFPLINKIIITPIMITNAIKIINKFDDFVIGIKYEQESFSLELAIERLSAIEVHNFVISLF